MKRADYARQLLNIVEELTKEDIHLYLTDVSTDNFAVDKTGMVKIIDSENIVLVDSLSKNMGKKYILHIFMSVHFCLFVFICVCVWDILSAK